MPATTEAKKQQGKMLLDVLAELYKEHGFFLDALDNFMFKGIDGSDRISALMNNLRNNAPSSVGNIAVAKLEDFKSEQMKQQGFPSSNVLKFIMEDSSWVAVRPSGTEPKCKFYFSVVGENKVKASKKLETMRAVFEANC